MSEQESNRLDYFICHAPPCPDWFKPEIEKPAIVKQYEKDFLRHMITDGKYAKDAFPNKETEDRFINARNEYINKCNSERLFLWPIYWAKEVLARL